MIITWAKWILIAVISFKIIAYIGYLFSLWNTGTNTTPMKWKMIKQLYIINPSRWEYDYYKNCYQYEMGDESSYLHLMYQGYVIRLSFFAYQILRFYYIKKCRDDARNEKNQTKKRILELAQEDVNAKMKEAQKYIDEARERMNSSDCHRTSS